MIVATIEVRLLAALSQIHSSIQSVAVTQTEYGLQLQITSAEPVPLSLSERLGQLACAAERILPLHSLKVNQAKPFLLREIREACPLDWIEQQKPPTSSLKALCGLLLEEATRDRTLIEVSRSGIYLGYFPQFGSRPIISPDEMIGKSLAEVVGERAQCRILAAIEEAAAKDQVTHCSYSARFEGDEADRQYVARVVIKPDGSGAYLSVARVDVSH